MPKQEFGSLGSDSSELPKDEVSVGRGVKMGGIIKNALEKEAAEKKENQKFGQEIMKQVETRKDMGRVAAAYEILNPEIKKQQEEAAQRKKMRRDQILAALGVLSSKKPDKKQ